METGAYAFSGGAEYLYRVEQSIYNGKPGNRGVTWYG